MAKGQAKQLDDGKWEVRHADGSTEVLTDKQFQAQYKDAGEDKPEQPTGKPDNDVPDEREEDDKLAKRVRPETNDGEKFPDDDDFTDTYIEEVEAELKSYEDGIKAVRAEIKSVKGAKPEDRDFASLRHAMHELSHGNPLTRTAHTVTVRHDGPERLRPAPNAHDNMSSGPGEETNPEVHRVVGR